MHRRFRFASFLASAFLATQAFAADAPPADPYATAREIIGEFQKISTTNGVEESFVAELNGTRQYVSVRGNDRDNPIRLFVHGGPAAPDLPISWTFPRPWGEFFTVVQWDQRASGQSCPLN